MDDRKAIPFLFNLYYRFPRDCGLEVMAGSPWPPMAM